jgi:hypothetical protein
MYTIPEAGLFLGIPETTLRFWITGKPFWQVPGTDYHTTLLSFNDVAQAHFVDFIRRHRNLSVHKSRDAMGSAYRQKPADYLIFNATQFDTIEGGSTFYHAPSATTVRDWYANTGGGPIFEWPTNGERTTLADNRIATSRSEAKKRWRSMILITCSLNRQVVNSVRFDVP